MKLSLFVQSRDSDFDHAICHSFQEARFINENFETIMMLTERNGLEILDKKLSNMGLGRMLIDWIQKNEHLSRPLCIILSITTESAAIHLKWYDQCHRYFKHVPPKTDSDLVENTVVQLPDFSWLSVMLTRKRHPDFVRASNVFLVLPEGATIQDGFPMEIVCGKYSLYYGELSGERCYPAWLPEGAIGSIIDELDSPNTSRSTMTIGQPRSNGLKTAQLRINPLLAWNLIHVEYTKTGVVVTKHPSFNGDEYEVRTK